MWRDGIVQGADIEATIIPTSHIELSAFYSYVDPYFTSNTVDGVDLSKFPVANIVRHKASLTATYLLGLPASIGDASVSATYSWQSAKSGVLDLDFSTTADPLHGETPSYGLLNLRADGGGFLAIHGSQCLLRQCHEQNVSLSHAPVVGLWGQDTGQYGPPRMFGVSARWHFGHY